MTLEQLKQQIREDLKINMADLSGAAAENCLLHNKYSNMLIDSKIQYKKEYLEFQKIKKNKYRYYMGYEETCPPEVLDARGVKVHIEGDDEVLAQQKRLFLLEEKINYLETTIASFTARGFNIKNIIEVKRLEAGI